MHLFELSVNVSFTNLFEMKYFGCNQAMNNLTLFLNTVDLKFVRKFESFIQTKEK